MVAHEFQFGSRVDIVALQATFLTLSRTNPSSTVDSQTIMQQTPWHHRCCPTAQPTFQTSPVNPLAQPLRLTQQGALIKLPRYQNQFSLSSRRFPTLSLENCQSTLKFFRRQQKPNAFCLQRLIKKMGQEMSD